MTVRSSRRITGMLAGCVVLTALAAIPAAAQAQPDVPDPDLAQITGSIPGWAQPSAKVADSSPGQQRTIQVALTLRDPAGAQRLARAVSTPGSPQFGRYLSAQEFVDRFGPSDHTVAQVRTWLAAHGLQVGQTSANKHFITARASVGTLEATFRTQLATYRVAGTIRTAPQRNISIPRALRPAITAVLGLDDSARALRPAGREMTVPIAAAPRPLQQDLFCSKFWAEHNNTDVPQKFAAGMQTNALCGYTPGQVRAMYGLTATHTGAGQTIGLVGAYDSASIVADTNQWASTGSVPLAPGQYRSDLPPGGFPPNADCDADIQFAWKAEQTMDVQAAHTIAPAAALTWYAAKDCTDMFAALNRAVQADQVSVISNSWLAFGGENGIPAATRDQLDAVVIQAAIQGQAILFCTGDQGDNNGLGGRPAAPFPASNPWITAVGGTTVALSAQNTVLFTAGWESAGNTQSGTQWIPQRDQDGAFAGGAGGGQSALYDLPDYQRGITATTSRATPDIAALADPYTGFQIGMTTPDGFVLFPSAGTSLASPLIAGLVADAQQAKAVTRLGFLNAALYAMRGNTTAITDVKPVAAGTWAPLMATFPHVTVPTDRSSYLVDVDGHPQSLRTRTGWDPVTGIGTPGGGFIAALAR